MLCAPVWFQLVNMCSNDGQRLFEVLANAPFILGGPLIFVAGSVYLVYLIGYWALVGIGTFVAFFVLMVRWKILWLVACSFSVAATKCILRRGLL